MLRHYRGRILLGLLVVASAACALSGCVESTVVEEPASSIGEGSGSVGYVEPAWMEEDRQTVRLWATATGGCLEEQGWQVMASPDGWVKPVEPLSDAQQSVYDQAVSACFDQTADLRPWSPSTADEWRVGYARALDTRDCLVAEGYEVSDPPSEKEWVKLGLSTGSALWVPFGDVMERVRIGAIQMDDDTYYALFDKCRQAVGYAPGPPSAIVDQIFWTMGSNGGSSCEEGGFVTATAKASHRAYADAGIPAEVKGVGPDIVGAGPDIKGGLWGPYSVTASAGVSDGVWWVKGSDTLFNHEHVEGCSVIAAGGAGVPSVEQRVAGEYVEPGWMGEVRGGEDEYMVGLEGCLAEAGWAIMVDPDGTYGPVEPLPEVELDEFLDADVACHSRLISVNDPPREENWRVKYGRALDTAACLVAEGYEITDPPGEDVWVGEAMADGYPGWVPFEQVVDQVMTGDIAMDADTYYDLYATCTQGGPTVTMDW